MSGSSSIIKKELLSLAAEKTLILSLFLQLFVAGFSSFVGIGLLSLYDPSGIGEYRIQPKIGVVGYNEKLDFDGIRAKSYPELMDAMDDFYLGRIDGVLFVPAEDEIIELELWLPKNDIRGTLLLVALKPKLENFEESVRAERSPHLAEKISIPSKGYRSSFFELTYTLLLPLLIFLPSILSGALCIDIITREFEDKTIESLLVTPLSLWEVVKGKILAAWIIAPPQATLWISLFLINGILVHNPLLLILLSAFIAMLLVVAAAFLSLFLRERTSTQFFYSLILIIFFTLSFSLMDSPVGMSVRIALGKESPLLPLYGILALAGYLLLRRFSENFDPF